MTVSWEQSLGVYHDLAAASEARRRRAAFYVVGEASDE